MLDYDYKARLQLGRERAAELARDYQRAQKLEARGAGAEKRAAGLGLRLARLRRQAARA
jgi:hypothetical protein